MTTGEQNILDKVKNYSDWFYRKLYYSVSQNHKRSWSVKRGEVFFVDLGTNIGSEENKIRPVVAIQSNSYSFNSPVFTCAIISNSPVTIPDIQIPITGSYAYTDAKGQQMFLTGAVDLGQIKTIAKERIKGNKICQLVNEINEIDEKLLNVFGLAQYVSKKDSIIASLQGKVEYLTNKCSSYESDT